MSERCHVCGPVKHEAPTVICAPCALTLEGLTIVTHRRIEERCAEIVSQMFCDFGSTVTEGFVKL